MTALNFTFYEVRLRKIKIGSDCSYTYDFNDIITIPTGNIAQNWNCDESDVSFLKDLK